MVETVGRNAFQFSRDSRRFHFSHASTDYFDTLSISLAWLGGFFCRVSTISFFFFPSIVMKAMKFGLDERYLYRGIIEIGFRCDYGLNICLNIR